MKPNTTNELRELIQQALITVEYDYREAHQEILEAIEQLISKAETEAYNRGYSAGHMQATHSKPMREAKKRFEAKRLNSKRGSNEEN